MHPHADFGVMHCMNTDLSDQALTLTVPVNQVIVARAPIDLANCRRPAWWQCRTSKPSSQRAMKSGQPAPERPARSLHSPAGFYTTPPIAPCKAVSAPRSPSDESDLRGLNQAARIRKGCPVQISTRQPTIRALRPTSAVPARKSACIAACRKRSRPA